MGNKQKSSGNWRSTPDGGELLEPEMVTVSPIPVKPRYYINETGPRVSDRQLAWAMLTMSAVASTLFIILIVLTVVNN